MTIISSWSSSWPAWFSLLKIIILFRVFSLSFSLSLFACLFLLWEISCCSPVSESVRVGLDRRLIIEDMIMVHSIEGMALVFSARHFKYRRVHFALKLFCLRPFALGGFEKGEQVMTNGINFTHAFELYK